MISPRPLTTMAIVHSPSIEMSTANKGRIAKSLALVVCALEDHTVPRSRLVASAENLAYACIGCNVRTSNRTHAPDPIDGEIAPIYNLRPQRWSDHFCWSSDSRLILGLTPTGRASVVALSLNRPLLIAYRILMIMHGMHPPVETSP